MQALLLITSLLGASSSVVLHKKPTLVGGWARLADEVDDNAVVQVRFALKLENLDRLSRIAASVSDPRSSSYGQYLTAAEIREMVAPKSEHKGAVEQWLSGHNIPYEVLDDGEVVEASFTIGAAKALLNTKFHYLSHTEQRQKTLRAHDFELPKLVDDAVAAVYGLHGMPLPTHRPHVTLASSSSPVQVTPAVLASTYKISGVKASGSSTNRQAVAEFEGQTLNPADLASFFKKYSPNATDKVRKFVGNNGVSNQTGVEAGLDIEYIMGVAQDVQTEYWYWGGNDFCADLKNWTSAIISTPNPPLVHSVSYGWQGDMNHLGCKATTVQDVDSNLQKLAAMGITIIFSSGDSGSGYTLSCSDGLLNNTGVSGTVATLRLENVTYNLTNLPYDSASRCCAAASLYNRFGLWSVSAWEYSSKNCTMYSKITGTVSRSGSTSGGQAVQQGKISPSWPASSPWVTAVGATRFVNQKVGQPEMASDQFGSGGGFSCMFGAFDSQKDAVQKYLQTAKNLPPSNLFDASGRATPDVSVMGEGYMVMANSHWSPVGGTSASAPAFAGMISLLNEERLKAGKPAMGYLNPFLYQNADVFTDVTIGTNAIGRGGEKLGYGFETAKGWDPATGLGTPIFRKMLSAAMTTAPSSKVVVV